MRCGGILPIWRAVHGRGVALLAGGVFLVAAWCLDPGNSLAYEVSPSVAPAPAAPPAPPIHCAPGQPGVTGQADAAAALPGAQPATPGEICLACNEPVGAGDVEITYRGRRVALHEGACVEAWKANSGALFVSLQPRGALFQEPAEIASPIRSGWFLVGGYILAGLIFGALCGYLAVGRGMPAVAWFFGGFVLNILALGFLLTRPRPDTSHLPAGIPAGLAKVPTTVRPSACPHCGAANHPAARQCGTCHRPLNPTVEPEIARA